MKVECINNDNCPFLTVGQVYAPSGQSADMYVIRTTYRGGEGGYYKWRFKIVFDPDVRTCEICGLTDPPSDEEVSVQNCSHKWVDP